MPYVQILDPQPTSAEASLESIIDAKPYTDCKEIYETFGLSSNLGTAEHSLLNDSFMQPQPKINARISKTPVTRQAYYYKREDNREPFLLNEGLQLETTENSILRGPIFQPNSVRGILSKLNSRLQSQNYDPYYLNDQALNIHRPGHKKFDRFFEAKVRYSTPKTAARHCVARTNRDSGLQN